MRRTGYEHFVARPLAQPTYDDCLSLELCACVCVCVRERESERARETAALLSGTQSRF